MPFKLEHILLLFILVTTGKMETGNTPAHAKLAVFPALFIASIGDALIVELSRLLFSLKVYNVFMSLLLYSPTLLYYPTRPATHQHSPFKMGQIYV